MMQKSLVYLEVEKKKISRKQPLIRSNRDCERVTIDAIVSIESSKGIAYGTAINISTVGLYLESRVPFNMGEVLKLSLELPRTERFIMIKGEVVTINLSEDGKEMGLGIRFLEASVNQYSTIQEYIESYLMEAWFKSC